VLAGGLGRLECQAESFPHRIERRFTRTVALIDRAEGATDPEKARNRLRRVARRLDKTADRVEHLGGQRGVAAECLAALSTMFAEGERRALELSMAL